MLKKSIFVGFGCLYSSIAAAQTVDWESVKIGRDSMKAFCNESNVFVSFAGNDVALVFSQFGVALPAGSDEAEREMAACKITLRLTLPPRTYIERFGQLVLGGVVKTQGARGQIRSTTDLDFFRDNRQQPRMFGTILRQQLRFAPRTEMAEPLFSLPGTKVFTPAEQQTMCRSYANGTRAKVEVAMRIALVGRRVRPNQSIMVQVDSSDINVNMGAQLGTCR